MEEKPAILRAGDGETLDVLGVGLRFLCGPGDTSGRWSLTENIIPKDAGPPPHHHAWDEAYYVVAGEVDFEINGRSERVGPGEFVYAPGGTVHAFRGASQAPARMLIFDAPAHSSAFFRDVDREVTEVPRDLPKMPGIGAKHGVHFVQAA